MWCIGGWCREKVVVPATKPYITFQGAGRDVTVIEWHDRASDRGPNGQQLRTYRTASVTVLANYFTARNISFKVCTYPKRHRIHSFPEHILLLYYQLLSGLNSRFDVHHYCERKFVSWSIISPVLKNLIWAWSLSCICCIKIDSFFFVSLVFFFGCVEHCSSSDARNERMASSGI